jgi:hypothetical protein
MYGPLCFGVTGAFPSKVIRMPRYFVSFPQLVPRSKIQQSCCRSVVIANSHFGQVLSSESWTLSKLIFRDRGRTPRP